jgi:hypothetical protein
VAGAFVGQVIAKSVGGALWAWVLARRVRA